tara:strand:- start:3906 stop:4172 length:267 start_codon:yes stop_codon:yes gene_type:complete
MSIYKRKFIASSKLFWGFTKEYDIRLYDNLEQIIKDFQGSLINLLRNNNLQVLKEECKKCNFHCHTHLNFEEILINQDNRDIYLCDGC